MPDSPVAPIEIVRHSGSFSETTPDLLAVEEPLEIRIGYGQDGQREQRSLAVTMRTPGHDLELAAGFLYTEGLIRHRSEIMSLEHCATVEKPEEAGNVVRAELSPEVKLNWKRLERHFYTSSSCGVCGKTSIEAVHQQHCHALPSTGFRVSRDLIKKLPAILREAQAVFEHTGGLHATALFDAHGELHWLREDIGRHNALDKVIGAALLEDRLPLSDFLVLVSGRAGFELVQKSVMAGVPLLAAVGAPSSLATQLSRSSGQTLIGFLREDRFNVYAGVDRIE